MQYLLFLAYKITKFANFLILLVCLDLLMALIFSCRYGAPVLRPVVVLLVLEMNRKHYHDSIMF